MRTLALSLLLAAGASAQDGSLTFREAVTPSVMQTDKTTGMTRTQDASGMPVWVGKVLLALGPGDAETVGVDEDPLTGSPYVTLVLAEAPAEAFARITEGRVGKAIAVMLDGNVLMAPVIQSRITGGRVSIEGVSRDEAEALAASIRKSTGAVDPVERMRDEVDLSSPEGAAVAYVTALDAADWRTVATVLHPDSLRDVRESAAEETVELRGDRAHLVGDPSRSVSLAEVLGTVPRVARYADLSDADAVAVWFAVMHEAGARYGGRGSSLVPVGTVRDGDRVHVVLREPESPFETEGFTDPAIVTVRRSGEGLEPSWRALFRINGVGGY